MQRAVVPELTIGGYSMLRLTLPFPEILGRRNGYVCWQGLKIGQPTPHAGLHLRAEYLRTFAYLHAITMSVP